MRTLFIIPLVLMSLLSFPSWGKGISGQFLCEVEYRDGSSDQFFVEVEKTTLTLKNPKYSNNKEYQLIYENSDYHTAIFEMFPSFSILSPGTIDKEIEFHRYSNYRYSRDLFESGVCVGPLVN